LIANYVYTSDKLNIIIIVYNQKHPSKMAKLPSPKKVLSCINVVSKHKRVSHINK
jgi:hypothetical protein